MIEKFYTVKELKEYFENLPDNTPIYSYEVEIDFNEDVDIVDVNNVEVFGVGCEIEPNGRLYMGV